MMDRRHYIGGSDVAAILGVSPWRTPVEIYLEKIRETPLPEPTEEKKRFFARRKQQEPVIARMLSEEYGVDVTRLSIDEDPNRYTDSDLPFLAAEIDFEFRMSPKIRSAFPGREDFSAIGDGELLNGEIKTVHPFKAIEWGEQGSEEVPIHHAAQVMHGLGVTRRPASIVAALFGLDSLLCFPVMADAETISDMRMRCKSFWIDHVEPRIPPDPVNLDDISLLYARRAGTPLELSGEGMRWLRELSRLRYEKKRIEDEIDAAQFEVAKCAAAAWGFDDPAPIRENAVFMFGGAEVGSWRMQRGAYLDQKQLKQDFPDLVRNYTKETSFRVMRIAKGV